MLIPSVDNNVLLFFLRQCGHDTCDDNCERIARSKKGEALMVQSIKFDQARRFKDLAARKALEAWLNFQKGAQCSVLISGSGFPASWLHFGLVCHFFGLFGPHDS
jgi:hypothetical protein